MIKLVLSPLAEADMRSIWLYSAENWGRRKANAYLGDLRAAVVLIQEQPESGMSCDDIHEGYRRLTTGSHVIFYKNSGNVIRIVRVLHQSMDFQRHL